MNDQPDRQDGDGLPAEHVKVLGFVSDASVAIHDKPMVVWVDSDGEWWGGLPQSFIKLSVHNWTVDRWEPLPTRDGAEGAGERLMPLSDINDLDDVCRELGIQDSHVTPAEAVRELHGEIERLQAVAPPKPAPDAMREALKKPDLAYASTNQIAACRCGSFPTLYGDGARPDDGYRSLWCQTCMKHVTEMKPSEREVIDYWNGLREREHAALSAPVPPADGPTVPLADHDEISRKVFDQPWEIQSAIVTITAHCTVLTDSHPTGEVADMAGCISQCCSQLADALQSPAVAAEPETVRQLIVEVCDLLAERKHGNPARSAGHNARLALEAALRLLPVPPGAGERE